MAINAGVITLQSVTDTTAILQSTAPTAGAAPAPTLPYTYQWHRSASAGFTPSAATAIAGATQQYLSDSGLIPNSVWYYACVYSDSSATPQTATSLLQIVQLAPPSTQSLNQFQQATTVGSLVQGLADGIFSATIDQAYAFKVYFGQPCKLVPETGGSVKVTPCTADSDEVFGFALFNNTRPYYVAGNGVELAQAGSFIYLFATSAIAAGQRVQVDTSVKTGGVKAVVASSGASIVGYALESAAGYGSLIRVALQNPTYLKA